ncbi:maltase A2-like [Calliphora vicina]|uniref:maltase A2-like n=1 Tax=Calliphora vicina TaxID=7373 RepID=UPI00325B12D2
MKWSIVVYLCAYFTVSLGCQAVVKKQETEWWENASLYQIYPRSFQDSDGDGVGDLKGITSRLEYLKEIGITATWLSPIFESPMADFGYDISNFTRIDPTFGTLDDFDEMLAKAKQLGVKILLDFVPNHSSDESVWFQSSVKREPGFEDFYMWHDGKVDPANPTQRLPPSNWNSIFGGPMWTWHEERQQYYMHQFLAKQPDFNYSNPLVRQHMLEVLGYWLERGVDGFRIDAVPHIFEARNADGSFPDEDISGVSSDPTSYDYYTHKYTKDQYPTIELLYEWRAFLDDFRAKNGGDSRILLTESYSPIDFLSLAFSNATHKGAQIPMNFNLMDLTGSSTAKDVETLANNWMDTMWKNHQIANWVVGNHDSSRVANRIGSNKIDLLNIIVHSLPGTSITYYGEELGMTNAVVECTPSHCEDRDPERSPMQWNSEVNAGFSQADTTWLPLSQDYEFYNVETESQIGRSTLQIFKGLQELKKTSAFKNTKGDGGFSYKALTEQIFQIIRAVPDKEEYMILVNMSDKLQYVENLNSKTYEYVLMNTFSPHIKGDKADLSGRLYLMPNEAVVLKWVV